VTAPAVTIDITEAMLQADLGNFLTLLFGTDPGSPQVIRGQINRTASPPVATSTDNADTTGFILFQFYGSKRTTTNQDSFDPVNQLQMSQSNREGRWQVDFYGKTAHDWAVMFTTMFRDPYGCANLLVQTPLYADDAIQAPLVDAEEQWEERWMVQAFVQYNPTTTVTQQSATVLGIKLVNVDVTYPPT
jgi:hypothetical protein